MVQAHKVKGTRRRVNVAQGADTVLYRKTKWLKEPLESESITDGPVMDAARATLPDFTFSHIHLNKNLVCTPHRDGKNKGESRILFLGDFEGGELCFEAGGVHKETGAWFSFDPQELHWNLPITAGTKWALVAHSRPPMRGIQKKEVPMTVGTNPDTQEDLAVCTPLCNPLCTPRVG